MISLNLVLAGLRLSLKNCQVGEKWVSDDCSYLYKGLLFMQFETPMSSLKAINQSDEYLQESS
ncbi:hypothetical protein BSPWISOXPB_9927 [uncultured Gammaproteobacteria bacterium]|nr:hypothetical protein BSPWISOXPB_501 [uncultured Gammaproteobacteria bacterium]VVM23276.1 hypothetical protein BSPWISOXPB_9927 [uncultured Gammaproteobacteria bacterium]